MKKIALVFFSLFISINACTTHSAGVPMRIPNEFYVTEHWVSMTTSYDIDTKTQRLGTLYRRFWSFLLTYDFYDPYENKVAYARTKFFSLTAHFDVYDNNDVFLGAADEHFFAFFPTFDIYARDSYSKLATARMNFWGTTFTIYDPETNKEMAHMRRSFFRLKNDWTFRVTDRALFEHKGIDPRVFMTVIAFQGDREYWKSLRSKDSLKSVHQTDSALVTHNDVAKTELAMVRERLDAVIQQEQIDNTTLLDEKTVEDVAQELDSNFKEHGAYDSLQDDGQKINAFADYCLNLVQSDALTPEKKKAVLFLLKTRLEETDAVQ